MLKAARLVEDHCDAVDINLGCPQGIAKRGRYGAFLMEELDLLHDIVRMLSDNLKVILAHLIYMKNRMIFLQILGIFL